MPKLKDVILAYPRALRVVRLFCLILGAIGFLTANAWLTLLAAVVLVMWVWQVAYEQLTRYGR